MVEENHQNGVPHLISVEGWFVLGTRVEEDEEEDRTWGWRACQTDVRSISVSTTTTTVLLWMSEPCLLA